MVNLVKVTFSTPINILIQGLQGMQGTDKSPGSSHLSSSPVPNSSSAHVDTNDQP